MSRRRRTTVGPALAVAVVVTLFAAARATEPDPGSGSGFLREVGACLTLGLLVLSAVRFSSVARHVRYVGRNNKRGVPRVLGWAATQVCRDAILACVLSGPALVAAWDAGAATSDLLPLAGGLIAAVACGATLGGTLATLGLPVAVATVLAVSLGAMTLWPATLGWTESVSQRFPGSETPPVLLSALLLAAAVLGAGAASLRRWTAR